MGFWLLPEATHRMKPPTCVDPVSVLRQVVEDARRAGADVAIHLVEGTGRAMMRVDAIRRALDNLIGNAVTYGKRAEV